MKRILIAGSTGMLGSQIYNFLKKDFIVQVIKRDWLFNKNKKILFNEINKFKPDCIINAAALVGLKKNEKNKDLAKEINFTFIQNLVKICNINNVFLLQISTHSVFDGIISQSGFYEKDKPSPKTYYGQTKYLSEIEIQKKLNKYIILRLPHLFSSDLNFDTNFLKSIVEKIKKEDLVYIFKPLEISNMASADLVPRVIRDLLVNQEKGIIHYFDYGFFNWYDLVKKISKNLNIKARIIIYNKSSIVIRNTALLSNKTYCNYRAWETGINKFFKK